MLTRVTNHLDLSMDRGLRFRPRFQIAAIALALLTFWAATGFLMLHCLREPGEPATPVVVPANRRPMRQRSFSRAGPSLTWCSCLQVSSTVICCRAAAPTLSTAVWCGVITSSRLSNNGAGRWSPWTWVILPNVKAPDIAQRSGPAEVQVFHARPEGDELHGISHGDYDMSLPLFNATAEFFLDEPRPRLLIAESQRQGRGIPRRCSRQVCGRSAVDDRRLAD